MDLPILAQRVEKMEAYLDEHKGNVRAMEKTISELNTTILLLNQTVEALRTRTEARESFQNKAIMFFIAGVISAFVGWMVQGGMNIAP